MNSTLQRTSDVGPTIDQLARYDRDGYLVARQLFSPEEVAEIRDAFMALAEGGPVESLFEYNPEASQNDPLARYPRVMQPHRRPDLEVGVVAKKYLLDSRVSAYLEAFYGERPLAAQTMFYYKPPGARGQALHQDNFYLRVKPGTCMAAWAAIDPATKENGGLMIVPGSHVADIACPAQADLAVSFTSEYVAPPEGVEPVPVDLAAGDVLFFNGSVIHGSYPNSSKTQFRCAFISHYMPANQSESSHWYHPLVNFDGETVAGYPAATGGGPCGTPDVGGGH